jgi:hypothetical protein
MRPIVGDDRRNFGAVRFPELREKIYFLRRIDRRGHNKLLLSKT